MSDETSKPDAKDMLQSIFAMQTDLNNYVFAKNSIGDGSGAHLTVQTIIEQVSHGKLSVNDLPNQWLVRYSRAMSDELAELNQDLLWKWWSKDAINLQNVRVELIDILHFLISAMLSAGLSAEKVFDIYRQKHAVNFSRQDTGYSRETKTEDDNRGIS